MTRVKMKRGGGGEGIRITRKTPTDKRNATTTKKKREMQRASLHHLSSFSCLVCGTIYRACNTTLYISHVCMFLVDYFAIF